MNKENLNDSSLTRVWQHFNNDNTTVVLFTGFRGDKTYEENVKRNKTIAADLKNAGFGYFYVDGYWIENEGEDDERHVSEDSIFAISNNPNNSQQLIDLAHKLANKYDQDAIFVKTPDDVYLLYKNGKKESIKGSLKPGKLGNVYTKLHNNKQSNTFVFESERDAKGFITKFSEYIKRGNKNE